VEKGPARLSEDKPAIGALKQHDGDFRFEALEFAGQVRLRQMQPVRRAGDIQFIGQRYKGPYMMQFHQWLDAPCLKWKSCSLNQDGCGGAGRLIHPDLRHTFIAYRHTQKEFVRRHPAGLAYEDFGARISAGYARIRRTGL
jgi:hypothetical protein